MEYLSFDIALILFAVAVAAGFVDSIAGGGGLLSVPALLWAGMPPALALGTNKLQASFGSFTSSYNFWRRGLVQPRRMWGSIACTFVGAVLGTLWVQRIDPGFLAALIPVLLIGFSVYFLFSPRISDTGAHSRIGEPAFALSIGTSVGFYDGFFGPGTGSFFALAYVALLGYNLLRATAHTKVLNFTSNIASLITFIIGGNVVWAVGLLMAGGQFLGAWTGSHLAARHGAKLIRPLLVVVSLSISVKLLLEG